MDVGVSDMPEPESMPAVNELGLKPGEKRVVQTMDDFKAKDRQLLKEIRAVNAMTSAVQPAVHCADRSPTAPQAFLDVAGARRQATSAGSAVLAAVIQALDIASEATSSASMINGDTLAGDRVLRIVAERMKDSIRSGDRIARYGGDEFVVLIVGVTRRRNLERLAGRIARAVPRPIVV